MLITYLFSAAVLVACAQGESTGSTGSTGNRNTNNRKETSLFYTRLRYDNYYLPIYKNLQKRSPFEETEIQLSAPQQRHHDDHDDDDVTKVYYVNTNISLHDLSQNNLILESLDQIYKSRLIQSFENSYDWPEDRKRAADPARVEEKRCNRELDYLLSKLRWSSSSSSSVDNQSERGRQSGRRLRFSQFRGLNPELAAFFDSFATEEAGVLVGNTFWLGSWQQCQKRHIFDPLDGRPVSFRGRYCVASIASEEWLPKIEEKVAELKRIDYFKFDNQEFNYRQHFRIQLGICLPESCDSTIVDKRHADIEQLARLRLGQPYELYHLTDLYCLPDESSSLREISPSGKLFIMSALIWVALIVGSTWTDANNLIGLRGPTTRSGTNFLQRIVVSFSLIRSYQHLSHVSRPPPAIDQSVQQQEQQQQQQPNGYTKKTPGEQSSQSPEVGKPAIADLHFFDAFKVLAMMIILVGHIGMLIFQFCQHQLDFFTISPIYFHFMASGAFYVDWFFCMTGFITAYAMFVSRAVYTNRLSHWLYSVFHRYWRLAPIYVLTFWFCRSLFQHVSHGPLWDYGTSNASLRAICRQESWWVPLTLTSNLHPLHRECIMPAWYIANDMQFYLITPFVLLLLAYRPRLAWFSLTGMSLLSVLARIERYLSDPHARHMDLMHPRYDMVMRNNWDLHRIYLWPHYRISSYLIGILAGHYAFMVKSGQWSSPFLARHSLDNNGALQKNQRLSPSVNRALLAWSGLSVTCSMSLTSWILDASFVRSLEPYAKPIATLVYSVGHSVAGCGIAALFLALLFGHWPRARQFMELPLWTRLARINFFVYLFQVEIIIWANTARDRFPETGAYFTLQLLFFLVPALYALAWLVTLLVANPLAKLELEFVGVYVRVEGKPAAAAAAARTTKVADQHRQEANLLRAERERRQQEQVAAAVGAPDDGDQAKSSSSSWSSGGGRRRVVHSSPSS